MSNMDWLQTLLGGVSGAFTGASVANDRRSREAELARQAARQAQLDERQSENDRRAQFSQGLMDLQRANELGYTDDIPRMSPVTVPMPTTAGGLLGGITNTVANGVVDTARRGPELTMPDGRKLTLDRMNTPRARTERAAYMSREEARQQIERQAAENAAARKFTADQAALGRASNERIAGIRSAPKPPATGGAAFGNLMLIPPTQRASVINNRMKMGVIDQAIEALNQYPDAVGLGRGITPSVLRDRDNVAGIPNPFGDPEGVPARALLGNLASLEIRDRSGAAVTAAEFPRLRPFIPIISGPQADDMETILWKLEQFKKVIQEENLAVGDAFGVDLSEYTNSTGTQQRRGAEQGSATANTQQSPESLARNLVLNARNANPMGRPR